jgi:hypothetical protein
MFTITYTGVDMEKDSRHEQLDMLRRDGRFAVPVDPNERNPIPGTS